MDEDVKFEKLAQMTVGFTGADLANLLRRICAAGRSPPSFRDLDGRGRGVDGARDCRTATQGRVMTEAERTTIAYHESGHALVGHILEHSIRFIRFRLSAAARLWATFAASAG